MTIVRVFFLSFGRETDPNCTGMTGEELTEGDVCMAAVSRGDCEGRGGDEKYDIAAG